MFCPFCNLSFDECEDGGECPDCGAKYDFTDHWTKAVTIDNGQVSYGLQRKIRIKTSYQV